MSNKVSHTDLSLLNQYLITYHSQISTYHSQIPFKDEDVSIQAESSTMTDMPGVEEASQVDPELSLLLGVESFTQFDAGDAAAAAAVAAANITTIYTAEVGTQVKPFAFFYFFLYVHVSLQGCARVQTLNAIKYHDPKLSLTYFPELGSLYYWVISIFFLFTGPFFLYFCQGGSRNRDYRKGHLDEKDQA